jgi:glucokinase
MEKSPSYYIAVDVGGTNARAALFEMNGQEVNLLKRESLLIPQNYNQGLESIADVVNKLRFNNKIEGIALALPGLINIKEGIITDTANLPDYKNKPLKSDLEAKLGTSIRIAHDVNSAALGEAVFGLGKNELIFNFIIWGTGFGATKVEKLGEKIHISATELGWHLTQWIGEKDNIGDSRVPEYYVGGGSLSKKHGDLSLIADSDPLWEEVSQKAAHSLINLLFFHPTQLFIFGGGLITKRPFLLEKIKILMAENQDVFPVPSMQLSKLGDDAGLYGLLALFLSEII